MTDTERDRLVGLAEKASPGPWTAHDGIRQFTMPGSDKPETVCRCGVINAEHHDVAYAVGAEDEDHTLGDGVDLTQKQYNAAFIAAAHDMIALIKAQSAEIERLRREKNVSAGRRNSAWREIKRLRAIEPALARWAAAYDAVSVSLTQENDDKLGESEDLLREALRALKGRE